MRQRNLIIAVVISGFFHLTALAVIVACAHHRAMDMRGGGGMGGSVIVSFVGDGGTGGMIAVSPRADGGGKSKTASHAQAGRAMTVPATTATTSASAAAGRQAGAKETHADGGDAGADGAGGDGSGSGPLSAGSGGGAGGGHGGGIGPGRGRSDPRLSAIWAKINRSKYYPRIAQKNGWEGAPRVRFTITAFGQVESVTLAQSCGITALDQAALETVRRSTPLPHYPKPITLAIRYAVRE